MTKYNNELKEKAINEFIETGKKKAVADKYNIPLTTFCHWINNLNAIKQHRFTDEIKNKVIEEYSLGTTIVELTNKYNITEGTINSWVKNITRQRGVKSKCNNINYFETIDSEHKAYWLGFIMADGNISITNNQYSLKIHLQYLDRNMLDKLLKDLDCTNKILYKETLFKPTGKYHKSAYISITSKKLVTDLMKLGVIPNKTGKEYIPKIKDNLVHHFIRGFFDGDGIVSYNGKYKNGIQRFSVGFISNTNMINELVECIKGGWENIKAQPHPISIGISIIKLSGKIKINHLYDYLYEDCTICLDRKRDKLLECLSTNTEVTSSDTKL